MAAEDDRHWDNEVRRPATAFCCTWQFIGDPKCIEPEFMEATNNMGGAGPSRPNPKTKATAVAGQ